MNWPLRIAFALLILICGLVAERLVRSHVNAAGELPLVLPSYPLADLPQRLAGFHGEDRKVDKQATDFADEALLREYRREDGISAVVWLAYSRAGLDRYHHPEICMAVAGLPEDREGRSTLELSTGGGPIQKYHFGVPGDSQCVYYWHYTMYPPRETGHSRVQEMYQSLRYRPASLTVEVFTSAQTGEEPSDLDDFVEVLEAEVRALLGTRVVRGSTRLPVQLVRGGG